MKILVTGAGQIIASANNFEFGAWEELDTIHGMTVRKWKAEDENGNLTGYYIDSNPRAITGAETPRFSVNEVAELPEGWETGKYVYQDGAFIVNPDWTEPAPTPEEEIAALKETIATQAADIQLLNDTLLELLM